MSNLPVVEHRHPPLPDPPPSCPVSLKACSRRECSDGCGYIGARPWPPPPEQSDEKETT